MALGPSMASVPLHTAALNEEMGLCEEMDIILDSSNEDSTVDLGVGGFFPFPFAAPTMHPNLVSTLKSVISFPSSHPSTIDLALPPSPQQGFEADELGFLNLSQKTKPDDEVDGHIAVVPLDLIQNRRPFKCTYEGCDKTFKNPQTLKMHHKSHFSDGMACLVLNPGGNNSGRAGHNKKIPCRCPVCRRTFVGLYELRRHYGRKHSDGEKAHACKKCGKRFYIDVDLRDHEKLCGEPIECKCGMKFAFKCNLAAHRKAHPECQWM